MKLLLAIMFVLGIAGTASARGVLCDGSYIEAVCKAMKKTYRSMGNWQWWHANIRDRQSRIVREELCNCTNFKKHQQRKAHKKRNKNRRPRRFGRP